MTNKNDPITDRESAFDMAKRIQDYYHKRGYKWIRVWLEPEVQASGRKYWYIRSNASFSVNNLKGTQ